MGFYSPATIVDDAKRHGVEFRPVDVRASRWDCTLEPSNQGDFAVRMGLRYVKGLGEADGARAALAGAGAFEGFGLSRREALWEVRGLARERRCSLPLAPSEPTPYFPALGHWETIAWDYRASSHSTRAHPLAPLRPSLRAQGLPDARSVASLGDKKRVRYAGLVICRQRPGTASGVTFMTLEDETGFVNIVLWPRVLESYAILAKTAVFLGVTGKLEARQGVVHLIAETLWSPEVGFQPEHAGSRDFQ